MPFPSGTPSFLSNDTGHKALCPVSRYVDRAYLWAPALETGHTCGSRRLGLGIPVSPGALGNEEVAEFQQKLMLAVLKK